MKDSFFWRSYDVNSLLPSDWREKLLDVSQNATNKTLYPRSVTSREGNPELAIKVLTVNGVVLRQKAPWLYSLYKGLFCEMAQIGNNEPISTAATDMYGAVLNVQRGSDMRYEAHVDSNPVEGLLYVTDHPKGTGGELVVANNPSANSILEIDQDASILYPVSGNLVFFDARQFPHYVRPLSKNGLQIRIVVAMNFYTPSCSESDRPQDLNKHLFGYNI